MIKNEMIYDSGCKAGSAIPREARKSAGFFSPYRVNNATGPVRVTGTAHTILYRLKVDALGLKKNYKPWTRVYFRLSGQVPIGGTIPRSVRQYIFRSHYEAHFTHHYNI